MNNFIQPKPSFKYFKTYYAYEIATTLLILSLIFLGYILLIDLPINTGSIKNKERILK